MRRFYQFRLRTALAFMAVCALAASWFGANLREWQTEQQAILALGPAAMEDYTGHAFLDLR